MRMIVLRRFPTLMTTLMIVMESLGEIHKVDSGQIVFTTELDQAIEAVKDGEPSIVMSGLYFGNFKFDDVYRSIKKINPDVNVIIYGSDSVDPRRVTDHYDGIIPDHSISEDGYHKKICQLLVEGTKVESLGQLQDRLPKMFMYLPR